MTGGIYKIMINFHRNILIYDYLWFQLHKSEFQLLLRTKKVFLDLRLCFIFTITSFCDFHCSTFVAQFIKTTKTWLHPYFHLDSLQAIFLKVDDNGLRLKQEFFLNSRSVISRAFKINSFLFLKWPRVVINKRKGVSLV